MCHRNRKNMKTILRNFYFTLDLCQVLIYIKYKGIVKIINFEVFVLVIMEIIRKHIRNCGKSRYRISQDTGIDEAALCRMMQGAGCNVETVDILCKYFGLELVAKKSKKKAR